MFDVGVEGWRWIVPRGYATLYCRICSVKGDEQCMSMDPSDARTLLEALAPFQVVSIHDGSPVESPEDVST